MKNPRKKTNILAVAVLAAALAGAAPATAWIPDPERPPDPEQTVQQRHDHLMARSWSYRECVKEHFAGQAVLPEEILEQCEFVEEGRGRKRPRLLFGE